MDVGIILLVEGLDKLLAVVIGTHENGAAVEPAIMSAAAHQRAQEQALGDQADEADQEKAAKPQTRYLAAKLGKERCADEQQEHEGPGGDHPRHLPELAAE